MFRDVYKAANDDIIPSPALLKSILSKAEEKRRPVYIRGYVYAACAAAIALVIALPGMIHTPQTDILDATPAVYGEKQIIAQTGDVNETNLGQSALPKDLSQSISANNSTNIEETEQMLSDTQMTVVMSVNHVAISESASTMRLSSDATSEEILYEELSASDYFSYLGFSPDTLDIPENLTADFSSDSKITICKKDGEILSDDATFTYSGDAFLSVTTSTDITEVTSYTQGDEYEKSKFGNLDAVILFDGSAYQAYTIHPSGTALKITAVDLTEEQIKNIMISIAK